VFAFLKESRIKHFVLDIETDSTVIVDENTEKQRRGEFIGVLSQLLPQLAQMIQAEPQTAQFCGDILKFATAPFRAGRQLEGSIDDLVEITKAKADQPPPDDPMTIQSKTAKEIEQMKIDHLKEKEQAEAAIKAAELKQKDDHAKMEIASKQAIEMAKMRAAQQDDQARANQTNMKAMADREKHQADLVKKNTDAQLVRQKGDLMARQHQMKANDMMQRAAERRAAEQFKATQRGFAGGPLP
jgi:uncharacterized membrane protein YqiK